MDHYNYNIDFINSVNYISIDNKIFKNFIESYKKKKNDNFMPIFNNNVKYNYKNKKNSKKKYNTQCIIIRNNNSWYPSMNLEYNKKFINIIKSNLNKLSDLNFKEISNKIMETITTSGNINIIDTVCNEIINKNIYDKDYQEEYIKLSTLIIKCDSTDFINYVINKSNNKYYIIMNNNYIGSFNNIYKLKEYFNKYYNFKSILLKKLYDIFLNRFDIYNEIKENENNNFKKKRKILSIIEFISKLFINNLINFKLLFIINIELLHNKEIKEIIEKDIELLYIMWNIIIKTNNSKFNLNMISHIYNKLNNEISKLELSYRSQFFIEEITKMLEIKFKNIKKINENQYENEDQYVNLYENEDQNQNEDQNENDFYYIEDELIYNIKKNNLYNYFKNNLDNIDEYLDTLVFILLNNMNYLDTTNELFCQLLKEKIIDIDNINNLLSHTDEEIDEMMLDNKNIKNNIINLKKNFNEKFNV